jgi:hypothetical protein
MFNGPVTKTVRNLISCTIIAVRNAYEPLHVADIEIGGAPRTYLALRTQVLKGRYYAPQGL